MISDTEKHSQSHATKPKAFFGVKMIEQKLVLYEKEDDDSKEELET